MNLCIKGSVYIQQQSLELHVYDKTPNLVDFVLISLYSNQKILIYIHALKPRKFELRYFNILANINSENVSVYKHMLWCVKETSFLDVSHTYPKRMFDRKKSADNHFGGYIFTCLPPYKSNY